MKLILRDISSKFEEDNHKKQSKTIKNHLKDSNKKVKTHKKKSLSSAVFIMAFSVEDRE